MRPPMCGRGRTMVAPSSDGTNDFRVRGTRKWTDGRPDSHSAAHFSLSLCSALSAHADDPRCSFGILPSTQCPDPNRCGVACACMGCW